MDTAIPPTPGETTATPESSGGTWGRFKAFKEKNHLLFEVAFFFAGFAFDAVLLHRIDSIPLLIHQATYVVLLAVLMGVDHHYLVLGKEPLGFWGKVLSVRHWVIHFFLGTLLNAFLIFYFKSSSGLFSFLFLVFLAVVMIINELPRFRPLGSALRVGLWSFAVTNFLAYLIPVLSHAIHPVQYLASVAIGSAATVGLWKLYRRFTDDPKWTFTRAVAPGLTVQAVLLLLYLLRVVPPVPLSLKYIGIFQNVEKVKEGEHAGEYRLDYARSPGMLPKFLDYTGRDFYARPDDKAWAFIQLFAPDGFSDTIAFDWEFDDPKQGWVKLGAPYTTRVGGVGDRGFRTFGFRSVTREGTYRVRILTDDQREIGSKTFTVERDASVEPRTLDAVYR